MNTLQAYQDLHRTPAQPCTACGDTIGIKLIEPARTSDGVTNIYLCLDIRSCIRRWRGQQ